MKEKPLGMLIQVAENDCHLRCNKAQRLKVQN